MRKLFKNKAVSCKVTETVILRFFRSAGGILETQELFPKKLADFKGIFCT